MPDSKPKGGVLRKLSLAILSPLVFLGLLEGILAVAGVSTRRYPEQIGVVDHYWAPYGETGKTPGFQRSFPRPLYKNFPEKLPVFVRDKPSNGLRVFVFGESTVQGVPHLVGTMTDWLQLRLSSMLPGRAVEVVNAGNRGWHAEEIEMLARESLAHDPDAFLWMVGHNEFLARNLLTLRDRVEHPVRSTIVRAAWALRTTNLLARFVPSIAPKEPLPDRVLDEETPCWGPELDLLKRRFREITAEVVAAAKAADVPILLCTMPRNARRFAPIRSVFSESVRGNAELRARWESLYGRARAALDSTPDPEMARRAAALLREAETIDATPARLHYAMGEAMERAGDLEGARAAFLRAVDLDAFPMRTQSWADAVIREVAAAERVPLVDVRAVFDGAGPYGLAGDELIYDNVHPTFRGHYVVADAMLKALVGVLQLPIDTTLDVDWDRGRDALGIGRFEEHRSAVGQVLQGLKLVLLTGAVDDQWKRTFDACERALQAVPNDAEMRIVRGLLLSIAGRVDEARAELEEGLLRGHEEVATQYVFYWLAEPPYRRPMDAAGIDLRPVVARLSGAALRELEGRLPEPARRDLARLRGR